MSKDEYFFWGIAYLVLGIFGAIGTSYVIGGGVAAVAGEKVGTFANLLAGLCTLMGCWAAAFHALKRSMP